MNSALQETAGEEHAICVQAISQNLMGARVVILQPSPENRISTGWEINQGRMEERHQKGTTEVTVKDKTSGALESHSSVSCNNPKKDKSKTRRCITFFTKIKEATYLHVFC